MSKADWLSIVKMIALPIISSKMPHGDIIAPMVEKGIEEANSIPGASNEDKLAHVINMVNIGVSGVNESAGHQKIDPVLVNQSLAKGISLTVDLAKLFHKGQ